MARAKRKTLSKDFEALPKSGDWDRDYKKMADAFLPHVQSGRALPDDAIAEARKIAARVKKQQGDPARIARLAVDWVRLNPTPMALPAPDYTR